MNTKTDNVKRVTLPSGAQRGMPEHITDYIEPAVVYRKEFDLDTLAYPFRRHYLIKNKKRSVYTTNVPDNGKRA